MITRYLNWFCLTLLLISGWQQASADFYLTSHRSLKSTKEEYETWKKDFTKLKEELESLSKACNDSINLLNSEKNNLEKELATLEKKLIDDNFVIELKREISDYKASFVELASNFLYIPYSSVGIDYIAIPAFRQTSGSQYFNKYKIRYKLLKDYNWDINKLNTFLSSSIESLNKLNGIASQKGSKRRFSGREDQETESNLPPTLPDKEEILKSIREHFQNLTFIDNYKAYGEGWNETFLGTIIEGIEKSLFKLNPNTDELLNTFISAKLKLEF